MKYTTEHLYGVTPSLFKGEEYGTVLLLKIELGLQMLKRIRETTKDEVHYAEVEKAIQHNRALWDELNE